MEALNWIIEVILYVCLIVLVNIKADVRAVIMAAAFYLAAVMREGKR